MKVTVITIGGSKGSIEVPSNITTRKELVEFLNRSEQLTQEGYSIDANSHNLIDGKSKTELISDDSIIPTEDFSLWVMVKETKYGTNKSSISCLIESTKINFLLETTKINLQLLEEFKQMLEEFKTSLSAHKNDIESDNKTENVENKEYLEFMNFQRQRELSRRQSLNETYESDEDSNDWD